MTKKTPSTEPNRLHDKRIALIGYGAQGAAQAQNLRDSAVNLTIGIRESGESWKKACEAGFTVAPIADAVSGADLVALLLPDEVHQEVYRQSLQHALKAGATLLFAHGFSIHYAQLKPRSDLDVVLVSPKGTGAQVRASYLAGLKLPMLIAVHQDHSGQAHANAEAYAIATGSASPSLFQTTFKEETESDLFGEQAVLCGGMVELIKAGFETLVNAGFAPEIAYFECLHELKFVVDLLHTKGISGLNENISTNAEYGEYLSGSSVITDQTRQEMRRILESIQSGDYAQRFLADYTAGAPTLKKHRQQNADHQIEQVGNRLRKQMPWLE